MDLKPNNKDVDFKSLYEELKKNSRKQFEIDRNAKIQLTSALNHSSDCLELIIKKSNAELATIKSILSRFGVDE